MEKIVYYGGNVLISLICVGKIAGTEMSYFKGLEEVREAPMKRQGEGNDNGGDYMLGQGAGNLFIFGSIFL